MKKEDIIQTLTGFVSPVSHRYTKAEAAVLKAHVERHFGAVKRVFRETNPGDIRADVVVTQPAPERPFFTLLTMGMGAYVMDVPDDLALCELERAELLMRLPRTWRFAGASEERRWPVTWLRILAHIPAEQESWIGWGHVLSTEEKPARNVNFTELLLVDPLACAEEASYCELPDGSVVNFYQVVPLYAEEAAYRRAAGTDALTARFAARFGDAYAGVADGARPNCTLPEPPSDGVNPGSGRSGDPGESGK